MKTACKTCPSMPDLLANNRRAIRGGLDIGFGNGWCAACRIIENAIEGQSDPIVKQVAKMLMDALNRAEVSERENHADHLDDYIV